MLRKTLIAVLVLPSLALAQPERYELGQRLKAFEQAWDKQPDKDARKRALEILPKVTQQFFALQLGEAGRTLDEARWALESKEGPGDAVKWLTSLYAVPEKRLVDASTKELKIAIKQFYKMKGAVPEGVVVTVRIGTGSEVAVPLEKLPSHIVAKFPAPGWQGDSQIILEAKYKDRIVLTRAVTLSTMANLSEWLDETKLNVSPNGAFKGDISLHKSGLEIATWRDRIQVYADLAAGEVMESDISIQHMGNRKEANPQIGGMATARNESQAAISAAILGKRWYCEGTLLGEEYFAGDYSLSLPLGKSKTLPFRIYVPEGISKEKPAPLVIALHGAGGTENLFFEGYGDGQIVKECKKRKWVVVSPRSALEFSSGPPVKKLIDAIADRISIDQSRIFLVGHSMGAMQTIALCQEHPKLFAAAAALGGGGRVKDAKPFENLPFFIGVGSKDFALDGAKALNKSLASGGAKNITYKEYPDLEHLVIVREALPDVFALFDKISDASKKR